MGVLLVISSRRCFEVHRLSPGFVGSVRPTFGGGWSWTTPWGASAGGGRPGQELPGSFRFFKKLGGGGFGGEEVPPPLSFVARTGGLLVATSSVAGSLYLWRGLRILGLWLMRGRLCRWARFWGLASACFWRALRGQVGGGGGAGGSLGGFCLVG